MSSTNRGAVRSPNDYYVTNPHEIERFIKHWVETDQTARAFWESPRKILDPAAGGLTEEVFIPPSEDKIIKHLAKQKDPTYELSPAFQQWKIDNGLTFKPSEMSYPKAITNLFGNIHTIDTLDIRENSRAAVKGDFLKMPDETLIDQGYEMIITNPPFSLAIEFIKKSLKVVKPGGYVVMLLRLNFFGSQERNEFFLDGNMPTVAYVHAKRLGFTPDGKTDSIEYASMCWLNDDRLNHETKLRVLPY